MTSPFGFTAKTDGVDDHLAAHVNTLQGAADILVKSPNGFLHNGRIAVSVSSSDLTVAIKTVDNADPSASDPVFIRIGNTIRALTSALSVTKADGTNWFNSGSAELATLEVDYFVYIIWNTTPATDILDLGFSRYPGGRVFSDFSSTSTNEKYMAYANGSSPSISDDCVLIGRFAATLSASATFLWTVPTFTTKNLIQEPIRETRWLSWTPAYAASGSLTYTSVTTTFAKYKLVGDSMLFWELRATGTLGGVASTTITNTVPFEALQIASSPLAGSGNTATVAARVFLSAGTPDLIAWSKYDVSNYATSGSNVLNGQGFWEI